MEVTLYSGVLQPGKLAPAFDASWSLASKLGGKEWTDGS